MNKNLKDLYEDCYDAVRDKMNNATDGMGDGKFIFFDKPFDAEINLKEENLSGLHEREFILGVFYTYNRSLPADCVIVKHGNEMFASPLPMKSEDLLSKIKATLTSMQKRKKTNAVPLRWIADNIAVFKQGLTSTKCIGCSMGRIASVAEELSHYRVYR